MYVPLLLLCTPPVCIYIPHSWPSPVCIYIPHSWPCWHIRMLATGRLSLSAKHCPGGGWDGRQTRVDKSLRIVVCKLFWVCLGRFRLTDSPVAPEPTWITRGLSCIPLPPHPPHDPTTGRHPPPLHLHLHPLSLSLSLCLALSFCLSLCLSLSLSLSLSPLCVSVCLSLPISLSLSLSVSSPPPPPQYLPTVSRT